MSHSLTKPIVDFITRQSDYKDLLDKNVVYLSTWFLQKLPRATEPWKSLLEYCLQYVDWVDVEQELKTYARGTMPQR